MVHSFIFRFFGVTHNNQMVISFSPRFGKTKGEIRVKKSVFRGFEGFGPCLGISYPTHPHLGKLSQIKPFFYGSPLADGDLVLPQLHLCPRGRPKGARLHILHTVEQSWREVQKQWPTKWSLQCKVNMCSVLSSYITRWLLTTIVSRLFVKVCRASSAIGDERGGALSRVEDEDLPQRHTGCALTNMILIHKIFKSFSKCA